MRDNGLTATAYTSMGGIDPLVAEPVLTALAEAGIAAYATPPRSSPPGAAPGGATPGGATPGGATPAGAAPGGTTPAGGATAGGAPAGGAPAGAAPVGEAPPSETLSGVAPRKADGRSPAAGERTAEQDEPGLSDAPGDPESASPATEATGDSPAKADTPAKTETAVDADTPTKTQATVDADAPAKAQATVDAEVPAKAEAAVEAEIVGSAMIAAGFEELFVDSGSVERARAVIDRSTEDAEWQSLVEQFNAPSAPGHDAPVPRWPASEDVDENYEPLIDVPAGLIVGDDDSKDDEEPAEAPRRRDDPHDHYIPPEPPRGPRLDWISRAAWLGLIGGPVMLIVAALLDFDAGGRIMLIAVVGFIAGFLTLVIRMKDRLPPDDTPDDGAVV